MLVENLSNLDYHARKEISASNIKMLLENPYKFATGYKMEQTQHMALGTALHSAILEPAKFKEDIAVLPALDARTKLGKEQRDEFYTLNANKTIITPEQYESVMRMKKSVMSQVGGLFAGVAEVSIFGEIDGVGARCRPDMFVKEKGLIIDLKKTQDASPDGFTKAIANYRYDIQAAWYIDVCESAGIAIKEFIFVCVEDKEPFMVGVYTLSAEWFNLGRAEYKRALDIYSRLEDYKKPIFKNTQDGTILQTLTPPSYLFYKNGVSLV